MEIDLPLRMSYQKDPLARFIGKPSRTFDEYMRLIEEASKDDLISAILLNVAETALDFGEIEDLRSALLRFKAQGKSVYVYFEGGGNKEYLLSTVGDHIMGSKTAGLYLIGIKASTLFLKDLLDKLGIQVWVVREGDYKTFGDMFTRSSLSEADKEQLGAIVNDLYAGLVHTVAKQRGLKQESIEQAIQKAPLTPPEAKMVGLIDSIGYKDDLKRIIKEREPHRVRFVDFKDYHVRRLLPFGNPFQKRIALLHLRGMILPGDSQGMPLFQRQAILERPTLEWIEEIEKDGSIDAVLVRIDSPGGLESPTDQIWRALRRLGEKKPVIVQAGSVCASGGYYIASAGKKIVAPPFAILGSIGVLALKPDAKALADKVGIRSQTIQKGDHADLFSPWRGWNEGELKRLKASVAHDYEVFLETVALSRQIPKSEVKSLAGGRVYSGGASLQLGLIDRLGGFFEALEEAKKAIGLHPKDRVSLVVFPKEKGFFEALASRPLGQQDPYLQLAQNLGCVGSILDMLQGSQTAVLWPILVSLD